MTTKICNVINLIATFFLHNSLLHFTTSLSFIYCEPTKSILSLNWLQVFTLRSNLSPTLFPTFYLRNLQQGLHCQFLIMFKSKSNQIFFNALFLTDIQTRAHVLKLIIDDFNSMLLFSLKFVGGDEMRLGYVQYVQAI